MPWFKERNDLHPPVFFVNPNDFWNWRNAHRPMPALDNQEDNLGEVWEQDDRIHDGARVEALLNAIQGVKLVEPVRPANPVLEIALPQAAAAHQHDIIGIPPNGYAPKPWLQPYEPIEPEEREWKYLSVEEKLEWLVAQEGADPFFKELLEWNKGLSDASDQYEKGRRDGWDDGYQARADEEHDRDDD